MLLVSEKDANIARAIRQESHLLSFLVREKKDSEKNPRFVRDFKTLADVLVQEVVKHDLSVQVSTGYLFSPCLKSLYHGRKEYVVYLIICYVYNRLLGSQSEY